MYYLKMYWKQDTHVVGTANTREEALTKWNEYVPKMKKLISQIDCNGCYISSSSYKIDEPNGVLYLEIWEERDYEHYDSFSFGLTIEEIENFDDLFNEIFDASKPQKKFVVDDGKVVDLASGKVISPDGFCNGQVSKDGEHWRVALFIYWGEDIFQTLQQIKESCLKNNICVPKIYVEDDGEEKEYFVDDKGLLDWAEKQKSTSDHWIFDWEDNLALFICPADTFDEVLWSAGKW